MRAWLTRASRRRARSLGRKITASAFRPLGDLLLVELAEQETETSTGIALAGLEEEESNSGAVLAVGAGRYAASGELLPPEVAPGDSVMYTRCAARPSGALRGSRGSCH